MPDTNTNRATPTPVVKATPGNVAESKATNGHVRHRVTPMCEHIGCTTHARNVVRVTADGGVVLTLKMCQRHTIALGARGEVIGGVR
jgi:hypothetical protein